MTGRVQGVTSWEDLGQRRGGRIIKSVTALQLKEAQIDRPLHVRGGSSRRYQGKEKARERKNRLWEQRSKRTTKSEDKTLSRGEDNTFQKTKRIVRGKKSRVLSLTFHVLRGSIGSRVWDRDSE